MTLLDPVVFVDYYKADYTQQRLQGDREFYFVFLREIISATTTSRGAPVQVLLYNAVNHLNLEDSIIE